MGSDMRKVLMSLIVIVFSIATAVTVIEARDKSGVFKASDLIGKKVQSNEGKKLGEIKDLVIDPEEGNIEYAVLDFGGFLGIGDKYFAVPWEALNFTPDQKAIVLDVSKKDLKQAPGFDKNNWPDLGSQEYAVTIYRFYNIPME
jgi:sporulation protein YlmC with PRC-barrel domain